jgi:hypothetical protein
MNEEKVDFTLESEKTLADVVHSIEQWLARQKLVIVSLEIDGTPFGQGDLDRKKDLPVSAVSEVRITVSDFVRLEIDGIRALTSFFESLKAKLAARDEPALAELLKGYPQAAGTVRFILTSGDNPETEARRAELDKLFTGTTAGMIKLWDRTTLDRAGAVCDYFLRELRLKTADYDNLEHSTRKITADTIAKLRASAERLKEVPILLQTGKDGEAMQTIASFTELAQLFLHVVSDILAPPVGGGLRIDGADLESYSQTLNGHLRELVEAFEKKDYILIGDLCEYEIAPQIISLIDTVKQSLPA